MGEQYEYGGVLANVTPAAGSKGVILRSIDGRLTFLAYQDAGSFTDFDLRHDELSVTIGADALASFYRIGGDYILDHSPKVLGLRKVGG